ncbi:UvrD-helicase domain-containing protein [Aliarcobacter cryaerophilus]|uniref:DNA helicase n=1 Tax=Aliarcobacter cryaerophilus TaxID=28198 RepID=A0A2S9TIB3_9BACT|nr:UvrD-helicase domain-containing protein [Aliarcobacter cryaerophilus]PRM98598.1 DNA helicase [Arcobacter cryaerophilus gv. crypticus]
MLLTAEQEKIVNSSLGSFKINAVAGSGKTTTLLEYAKKNSNLRILYLAYNKSLQIALNEKLKDYHLPHLYISTIHSLAYNKTEAYRYKLTPELKTNILEKLIVNHEFQDNKKSYYPSLEYTTILKNLVNFYCNSNLIELDLKLLEEFKKQNDFGVKILDILNKKEKKLLEHLKLALSSMKLGKIEAIHDFYLKMFYLNKKISSNLNYDLILIDEAQDISDVMIGIIENQKCRKIYVGDSFQQIYSFRYASNALNKIDLPSFELTFSFRFSNSYAKFLQSYLNSLYTLNGSKNIFLNGIDDNKITTKIGKEFLDSNKPFTIISRTTFGLIQELIKHIHNKKRLFFEGGYNSYSFMNQTVYSIFYLKNRKNEKITVDEIKNFDTIFELETFAKETKNQDYLNIIRFVNNYGDNIFEINKKIKEYLVSNKDEADIIFTTTHKAKGMEYNQVIMTDDFITKKDILNRKKNLSFASICEELNIYYVAASRAKFVISLADLKLDYKEDKD